MPYQKKIWLLSIVLSAHEFARMGLRRVSQRWGMRVVIVAMEHKSLSFVAFAET